MLGNAGVMDPAAKRLGALDRYLSNTRSDNAIHYRGTYEATAGERHQPANPIRDNG
ncbi:hypothetical protein GCM10007242_27650 [Pigmentiphaga litoralis]|nr:hypothetical protein GCM10007242_27650 [Pigmentiphaga litoralis]